MADASNSDSVEIWKPIPGWEGLYEVCADRHVVRSVTRLIGHGRGRGFPRTQRGRAMTPYALKNGYLVVPLCRNGIVTRYYLHIAVCEAAHGPRPSPKHCVRHVNGDQRDNRPSNLRWGTQRENCQDTVAHGRSTRGIKNSQSVLTEADVLAIRRRCHAGETQSAVCKDFSICQGTVSAIICGRSWSWLKAG